MEIDRLERPDVPGNGQRILPDEQVPERIETVHRVAGSDTDDTLFRLNTNDRCCKPRPRDRIPCGRERRVEGQHEAGQLDPGDLHTPSIAQ